MAPSARDLERRNELYAASHNPLPTIAQIEAKGGPPPKTVIVSCVDPRVFPEQLLGLEMGEAFIFRTIAAHPQPVLKDIMTLDVVSKGLEDIIIIGHTDCGAMRWTNDRVREEIARTRPFAVTEDMAFSAIATSVITSVEESLREDVAWLKQQSVFRHGLEKTVRAYNYDLRTGKLHQVV